MAIVVKSGTVLSARGKVTIGENAKLAVNSKIGKGVVNKSTGRSDGSNQKEYFVNSDGSKTTPYETAAIKASGGAMTTSTGETAYTTVSVQSRKQSSSPVQQEEKFISFAESERRRDLASGSSGMNTPYERSGSLMTSSSTGQKAFAPSNQVNKALAYNNERVGYANDNKLFGRNDEGKRTINFNRIADNPIRNVFEGGKEVASTGYVSPGSNYLNTQAKTLGGGLAVGFVSNPFVSSLAGNAATQTIKIAGSPISQLGQAVVSGAPKGLKGVTSVLYTVETSAAAGKIGYELTKSTASPQSKAFINSGSSREAFEIANANALQGKSKVSQYLISNIPGGKKIAGYDQSAFDSSVKDYAVSKNYNPDLFAQSVKDYGKARNVGTTAAIITGNTASEAVGGALFSSSKAFTTGQSMALKGSFSKLFVQGAKVTGVAGIGEGAGIALGMEASTGKKAKDFDYKFVGKSAALGGVTAAAGGGLIYATSVLKPTISKGLLGVAYATEPAELLGDIAGGGSGAGIVKSNGIITFTNTPTRTNTNTRSNSLVSTKTSTSTVSPTNVRVLTTGVFTNTPTPTNTNVFNNVNVRSNIFSSSNTRAKTNVFVNTPVNTNIPTNTFVNTPVNTNIPTNTFVPVTTTTTKIPLGFANFGGGSNAGFKSGFGDFFKQSRSYNPSLFASVLNIKGVKPGDYGLKSGLGIRTI